MKKLLITLFTLYSLTLFSQSTFQESEVLFQPNSLSQSFVPTDVNNDGLPDLIIVVRWGDDQRVVWKKNLGGGQFSEESIITNSIFQPQYLTVGDLNNDGHTDLLVEDVKGTFHMFTNDGKGKFKDFHILRIDNSYHTILIDLNQDNFDDIAFWSYGDDSVGFLLNDKKGKFEDKVVIYDSMNKIADMDVNDYDNDGDLDIIAVSNSPGRMAIFENEGNLEFSKPNFISYSGRQPQSVVFAEMNGDEFLDIVATASANDDVSVFVNNGNGGFEDQLKIGRIDWADKLFVNDIDDDGDNDIFIGQTYGSSAIIYNEGNLNFSAPEFSIYVVPNTDNRYNNNYGAWTIWSIDIDGDCDQDVITQEENLFLFRNQAKDDCEQDEPKDAAIPTLEINLFPNPASDYINLEVEQLEDYQVNILTLQGKLVVSENNQTRFDLTDLPPGAYVMQVRDLKNRLSRSAKFIVAR